MIGKAVLSLLDHDEEYVLTFPSAYGRSILTVPWFEMGGQVSINCAKTGYNCSIEFLTKVEKSPIDIKLWFNYRINLINKYFINKNHHLKPFYGGKKHQITGTISGPDKKPFCMLEGDWNGTMFLRMGKKVLTKP
jgi:oxysterol-binding protein-related protein 9/10/11